MSIFSMFAPPSDKKCDELYRKLDDAHGLGLCEAAAEMGQIDMEGMAMGPSSLWVLGSKNVPRILSLIKGGKSAKNPAGEAKGTSSSEGSPAAPESQGKPRGSASDTPSPVEAEIVRLVGTGNCEDLTRIWTSISGHEWRFAHQVDEFIVIEQRLPNNPRKFFMSLFSSDGQLVREGLEVPVRRNVWRVPEDREANLVEIRQFIDRM